MPRPVFFQHLRKTAGTSLADTLRLFFRPESTAAVDSQLHDSESIDDTSARLRSYDLVTGHADILSIASSDSFKVAVFRDPFQRLLSERRQWMQAGPENLAAASPAIASATLLLQQRSIVDILDSVYDHPAMVPGFWNHQALTLGAWPLLRMERRLQRASAFRWSNMHEHFDSASELRSWLISSKAKIARGALKSLKTLDYVGLTEDFDDSVREIFARLGLPEPGHVVVRNARRHFGDEDDARVTAVAEEFLDLDRELYEAAIERHAVFGRAARGTPVDYVRRTLSKSIEVVVSAQEAPGGHGWHPSHQRADGVWSRWTGPGDQSRISLSAPPGSYSMQIELFGAASEQTLRNMQIEIEGRRLSVEMQNLPNGLWAVSATFHRARYDRFDLVLRFPAMTSEYGLEIKQVSFLPIETMPEQPPSELPDAPGKSDG